MHEVLCAKLSDVAEERSRTSYERKLKQARLLRETEADIAREAMEHGGMSQGEVAYLLGRSREWLRRRGIGGE